MNSVKDLCQKSGISPSTFYRMTKTDKAFKELIEKHRIPINKKEFAYDDIVVDWLKEYLSHPQDEEDETGNETDNEDELQQPQPQPQQSASTADTTADADAVTVWLSDYIQNLQSSKDLGTRQNAAAAEISALNEELLQARNEIVAGEAKIDNLGDTILSLEETIRKLEEDKKSLQNQIETLQQLLHEENLQRNQLLMLFAEEKREKQLMLTAPKESVFEKIGKLFGKKGNTQGNGQ